MFLLHKKNKKLHGFMLVSALLATLILMMLAHGFMLMYGGQFTYLQAAKTASQGQQYAEIVGEKVKLEGVDANAVTNKTSLENLTGNAKDKNWQYTYDISNGTEDDNGNIFKVATIKIYKDGENSPRYTYEVPLSSLGNSKLGEIHNNSYGYYCELANGLLIQWGRGRCYEYQRYPQAFKTAVSPVVSGGGKGASMVNVDGFNPNGFNAHLSDGYGQHDSFYWIAIGY